METTIVAWVWAPKVRVQGPKLCLGSRAPKKPQLQGTLGGQPPRTTDAEALHLGPLDCTQGLGFRV